MKEKESVNVNWQTLFAVIPIIHLWACYRIEKLRLFLIICVAMIVIEFLIAFAIYDDQGLRNFYGINEEGEPLYEPLDYRITVLEIAIFVPVFIVLIRKWSKEWNEKLSKASS